MTKVIKIYEKLLFVSGSYGKFNLQKIDAESLKTLVESHALSLCFSMVRKIAGRSDSNEKYVVFLEELRNCFEKFCGKSYQNYEILLTLCHKPYISA